MPSDERRYQVFVSSTFLDLQEERQKVLQAVLEMKAFPTGMEMFPSADDEQWEFIKREIQSSDYYVVIVAGKYGSVSPDGLSYTEREYDHAVALGRPVMGFLAKDLMDLKGAKLEQAKLQRQKLEKFREKVQAQKLVTFYTNPDELKSKVMLALMQAFRDHPQEGWVRGNNSRRMVDLEEINGLQRRVMKLQESELTTLRAKDPYEGFAKGDDPVEWTIDLRAVQQVPNGPLTTAQEMAANLAAAKPPVERFPFRSSWNEILRACFQEIPSLPQHRAWRSLDGFILSRVQELFHPSAHWHNSREQKLGGVSYEQMHDDVRRQFLLLGIIDIDRSNVEKCGHLRKKGDRVTCSLVGCVALPPFERNLEQ